MCSYKVILCPVLITVTQAEVAFGFAFHPYYPMLSLPKPGASKERKL